MTFSYFDNHPKLMNNTCRCQVLSDYWIIINYQICVFGASEISLDIFFRSNYSAPTRTRKWPTGVSTAKGNQFKENRFIIIKIITNTDITIYCSVGDNQCCTTFKLDYVISIYLGNLELMLVNRFNVLLYVL